MNHNTPEREQRLVDTVAFIVDYVHTNEYPPSIRDITNFTEVNSTDTTFKDLAILKRRGWVVSAPGRARTLRITELGHDAITWS